ncbi:hypothetical protein [uncultured Microbulbifer sp.]|uniref:hypothetical protein n=1 Tax=uncultured Microbulbifer sp. TaxID=348147 RepID=UPI00262DDF08|nr:hypothetical protein [uncultured Microbulbifer sp.]
MKNQIPKKSVSNKYTKLAAIRYKSLSLFDRIWLRFQLGSEYRLQLRGALNELKLKGFNKINYHDVKHLLIEKDKTQIESDSLVDSLVDSSNLPSYISLIESEGINNLEVKSEVTPHVKELLKKISAEYIKG